MRFFVLVFIFMFFMPMPAKASYWKECAVFADVTLNPETGAYSIDVISGKVTGGHAKVGSPCMEDAIDKVIEVNIAGMPPEDETVRLKYSFYNGMGENGAVNDESWEYWPVTTGDVLPW